MNTAIATKVSPTPKLQTSSHRFAVLLACQVALIAIHPWGDTRGDRPGWFGIFALAVILAGLYQVAEHTRIRRAATLLCAIAVAGNALLFTGYKGALLIPASICSMTFIAFITAVLLQSVISSRRVTSDTLYGAVSTYLFIGILWGIAYSVVDSLYPGSLRMTLAAGHHLAWADYIFFSFVTLTTIGYGDVVPMGAIRSLVILEGIIGAMYPAILIGRLLTMYRPSEEA
ncbi:MAG: hypothetical protein JOZ44_19025 [Acidobacteria bacterium]|nr:hypothetical protein [Acidobacteriota bacterium]